MIFSGEAKAMLKHHLILEIQKQRAFSGQFLSVFLTSQPAELLVWNTLCNKVTGKGRMKNHEKGKI